MNIRLIAPAVLAVTLTCASLSAATLTWNGSEDSLWSNAANWTPAQTPAVGDALTFPGSATRRTMTNDLPPNMAFGALTFDLAYTIDGNPLTLMGGITGNSQLTWNTDLRLG